MIVAMVASESAVVREELPTATDDADDADDAAADARPFIIKSLPQMLIVCSCSLSLVIASSPSPSSSLLLSV